VAVFSTLFVYLVTRKKWILAAYGIVALVVMFQRVEFGFHTTLQVVAGALVGCLVAVIAYLQGGTSVKGLLKQKQDDNYFGLNWSTQ
jgi:membrane-associated phospholipid phosphatase